MNIYKELTNDIEDFQAPKHGYLMGWAKQGRYSERSAMQYVHAIIGINKTWIGLDCINHITHCSLKSPWKILKKWFQFLV